MPIRTLQIWDEPHITPNIILKNYLLDAPGCILHRCSTHYLHWALHWASPWAMKRPRPYGSKLDPPGLDPGGPDPTRGTSTTSWAGAGQKLATQAVKFSTHFDHFFVVALKNHIAKRDNFLIFCLLILNFALDKIKNPDSITTKLLLT